MGQTSPDTASLEDPLIVDETGNLVNYRPYTEDQEYTLTCPRTFGPALDLGTGENLASENQGDEVGHTAKIRPGGGKMIFVGPPEEARKALQLPRLEPGWDEGP